jgi:carbon storage regulator
MLMLSRKHGESILIGNDIKITFYESSNRHQIRVGIEAPRNINIVRTELLNRKEKHEKE